MSSLEGCTEQCEEELAEQLSEAQTAPVIDRTSLGLDTQMTMMNSGPVHLSRWEMAVLEALMDHPQMPLSRERILQHARDVFDLGTDPAIIDVFICKIGSKFRNAGRSDLIKTVRGQGYMISGTVQ